MGCFNLTFLFIKYQYFVTNCSFFFGCIFGNALRIDRYLHKLTLYTLSTIYINQA